MVGASNVLRGCLLAAIMVGLCVGCASRSGSSGGRTVESDKATELDVKVAEERIAEPPLKSVPIPENPPPEKLRSVEMAERTSTGPANLPLPDVLFDFDQHVLRPDALTTVEANAQRLRDNGASRLLLEGRADEIGTVEYNLVLGERRAMSVKQYLENLGLDVQYVEVTSYGKDRPLCLQHHPTCWQKNRSVHFVVRD